MRKDNLRVLMLGWEFPPFISGGLGTACHGLTRALNRLHVDVLFVLPSAPPTPPPGQTSRLTFYPVASGLTSPYPTYPPPPPGSARQQPHGAGWRKIVALHQSPQIKIIATGTGGGYEGHLTQRVHDYAQRCIRAVRHERFDVIHAHDWMTFPAGQALAAESGKPLVTHIHATEFDRSGEHVYQAVYDLEREGMHHANAVICVSHFTRNIVLTRYGVAAGKVEVAHNGIELDGAGMGGGESKNGENIVLFLGRITRQKGPDYFLSAARRVLEKKPDVKFVVAGWGDLGPWMVEQVAAMGLGHRVFFTGFLSGGNVGRAYRVAHVYVMPSVSEPFGLTALEAVRYGTPAIISKSSGVAEVLTHAALKVDFWDVNRMADRIVAVLTRPALAHELTVNGSAEVRRLTWDATARKCQAVYEKTLYP